VVAPEDGPSDVLDLFRELRRTRDTNLRNRLVELHLDLAEHLVRKYRGRSAPEDDLRQIAMLGVLHAVDRFNPDKGYAFSTFANRTIEGDIKRYFRDRTWSVRPPRRAQELYLTVRKADEELTHSLGRSPRVPEIADHLDLSEEDVLIGLEAATAYRSKSLDQPSPVGDEPAPQTAGDRLGEVDERYDQVEMSVWLEDAIAALEPRERRIVEMRFKDGLTQPEIAAEIGVSQSYLSRLLRKTLSELRTRMTTPHRD
jgi:RNA polymerase sigma-B factor